MEAIQFCSILEGQNICIYLKVFIIIIIIIVIVIIIIIIIKYIYPRDLAGNTALHYAAQSGLKRSVFIPTFAHFLKLRPSLEALEVQLSWPSTSWTFLQVCGVSHWSQRGSFHWEQQRPDCLWPGCGLWTSPGAQKLSPTWNCQCGKYQLIKQKYCPCSSLFINLFFSSKLSQPNGQVALLLETHMVFSSGAEPASANEEELPNQEVSWRAKVASRTSHIANITFLDLCRHDCHFDWPPPPGSRSWGRGGALLWFEDSRLAGGKRSASGDKPCHNRHPSLISPKATIEKYHSLFPYYSSFPS